MQDLDIPAHVGDNTCRDSGDIHENCYTHSTTTARWASRTVLSMTTNNGAGGLVAKWREESKLLEKSFAPSSTIIAVERRWCARELEAALQAQADAVPCKTVIVYGDHGPEEREPVEDYYTAPPSDVLRRVVEAAEGLRQRQREYLADAAGHRDNAKGALVGVAADHLDAVLAAAHKALAEGVGRDR